jgi:hypothetical protein
MFHKLMIRLFERHGREGENTLNDIRPVSNKPCFRDRYRSYTINNEIRYMLYYDQKTPQGFTCRAVSYSVKFYAV